MQALEEEDRHHLNSYSPWHWTIQPHPIVDYFVVDLLQIEEAEVVHHQIVDHHQIVVHPVVWEQVA